MLVLSWGWEEVWKCSVQAYFWSVAVYQENYAEFKKHCTGFVNLPYVLNGKHEEDTVPSQT